MQQDHLRRAGGLGEVVGGKADAPLRRRQAEAFAHRPRQEGIDRRALRPDALLQAGQDQPVRAHQARLQHAQNHQPRMAGAAGADPLAGQQAVEQVGEPARRGRGQGLAVVDEARQQGGEGFTRLAGP